VAFTTTVTGRHQDEGIKLARYWKRKIMGWEEKACLLTCPVKWKWWTL